MAKLHAALLSRIAEIYDYRQTYEEDMVEPFEKLQRDEHVRLDESHAHTCSIPFYVVASVHFRKCCMPALVMCRDIA